MKAVVRKFMKRHIYIILTILLSACRTTSSNKNNTQTQLSNADVAVTLHTTVSAANNRSEDTTDLNNATYFIVIADTSRKYYTLHKKMFDLNRKLNISIDTLGRFYNTAKSLIALPDNNEDEIYAGSYFPRRFPSHNLSLEYLIFYQTKASKKTIALLTGIYENEKSADSALAVLQKTERKVFKLKTTIYVGCIH